MSNLKNYQIEIEKKFQRILKVTQNVKYPDWSIGDLDKVLKTLKKSQSQDSMEMVNELFLFNNIGTDLKSSLLSFFNGMKNTMQIPDFLKKVFITAIPKKQKSPLELKNQRGIFLIPKLRVVLIKLIYNSIIDTLEVNLSPSNIGARRNKSPRDHLFVVYSVMNETLRGKEAPLDIVFTDISECYDSLWSQRTLTDLFENGVDNNLLNLISELTKSARIQIKTPVGTSKEAKINDIIMQGETLSSILCTNTMDKMSADCRIEPLKYRDVVNIPKLGFVDDNVDITKCGKHTEEVNKYTTTEVNKRKLQLNADKCVRMHVQKKGQNEVKCSELKIDYWRTKKVVSETGEVSLKDEYGGETDIKTVENHLYL